MLNKFEEFVIIENNFNLVRLKYPDTLQKAGSFSPVFCYKNVKEV